MSTRKLILTAVICGIAILVAGSLKLFLVANDDTQIQVLALHTPSTLGDMTVSVEAVNQDAEGTIVSVTMVGVDGADAREGWRLLAGGKVLAPTSMPDWAGGVACDTTVSDVANRCDVAFPTSSGSVTVAYLRAGTQSQWAP
jgi:hypothetical protein